MISFAHDATFASVPIAIAGHFSKTANGGALTAFNDITIMRTKQTTSATYEDYMRLPEGAPYQLIAGQLDLVVEVLSPSTARNDLNPKRRMYESSGVLEYWIVDPATSSIEILTNDAGQFATHDRAATSGLVHSKVLRGFTIDVADVFR